MKAGWQTKTLAEVCQIKPPKAEARRRFSETDSVSFVPMEDMGIDQKIIMPIKSKSLVEVVGSYTYFAEGDVLLAKITPCFENGKLGIAANLTNGIGFGSSEYIVFRPDDSVNKEWLYYFLSREVFRVEGAAHMSGAVGHKRVAKEFIESYPIPIPPLPEQQRIVGILDEAFDGIATAKANAEKNCQNARALFDSYQEAIFTTKGDVWVEERLEDMVDASCSLSYGIVQPGEECPDGLPIVRPTDLVARFITLSGLKRINPALARAYKKTTLVGGELLLCVRGSTGIVAVASKELVGGNVTRGIVPIRFKSSAILPEFGYYLFTSSYVQNQIKAGTYGAALMQINIRDIRKILLTFPSMQEQQRIVAQLDSLSEQTKRLEAIYQQKLDNLAVLKQSLMQKAFAGELHMDRLAA